MRTVVINADLDWQFTRLVRLHALDCYHPRAATWFWTLEPAINDEFGPEIWGGFPENFVTDRLALTEECIGLADWLIAEPDERLSLLVVLPQADVEALRDGADRSLLSSAGKSAVEAFEAFLSVIDDESSNTRNVVTDRGPHEFDRRVTEARTRLWASIVSRELGSNVEDREIAREALEQIGPRECHPNSAFLLSLGASGDRAGGDGSEKYFLKLRQVMELTQAQDGRANALDSWGQLRAQPGSGIAEVYHVEALSGERPTDLTSRLLRQFLFDWIQEGVARQDEKEESDLGAAIDNLYSIDDTFFTNEAADGIVMAAIDKNADQIDMRDGRWPVETLLDTQSWRVAGWLRNPTRRYKIETYQEGYEKALTEFERVQYDSIGREVKEIRRKGTERRPGLINGMLALNVPAGTKGLAQLEQPMKRLRQELNAMVDRVREFGTELEQATKFQNDARAQRNQKFLLAKDAEDKLLPRAAFRWPAFYFVLFLGLSMLFAVMNRLTGDVYDVLLMTDNPWFWVPTLAIPTVAVLTGMLRAYLYARARSKRFNDAAAQADRDQKAARKAARAQILICQATEQASALAILYNYLSPQHDQAFNEIDTAFFEHMIRVQGPSIDIQNDAVREAFDALKGDRETLLVGEDLGQRVRNFLSKHNFEVDGLMNVAVWGNQRVQMPSQLAGSTGLALKDPGKPIW